MGNSKLHWETFDTSGRKTPLPGTGAPGHEDEISSSETGVVQCCKAQEGKHSRWQRLQRNYQGPWQTTRTKAETTEVEEPG